MARSLFRLVPVSPGSKVRIDTASGSPTPAEITPLGGGSPIVGSIVSSQLYSGHLPAVLGPHGVTTLYQKPLDAQGLPTGQVTTVASDQSDITVGGPQPLPVARKYKTGNQGATTNFVVAVTLDSLEYNRDAIIFDTSVADAIKVLQPGPYLVTASVNFVGGTTGDRTGLITVNGTVAKEFGLPGTDSRPAAADVLMLAANDTVGLSVYTVGGTSINGVVPKDVTLTVTRLGA